MEVDPHGSRQLEAQLAASQAREAALSTALEELTTYLSSSSTSLPSTSALPHSVLNLLANLHAAILSSPAQLSEGSSESSLELINTLVQENEALYSLLATSTYQASSRREEQLAQTVEEYKTLVGELEDEVEVHYRLAQTAGQAVNGKGKEREVKEKRRRSKSPERERRRSRSVESRRRRSDRMPSPERKRSAERRPSMERRRSPGRERRSDEDRRRRREESDRREETRRRESDSRHRHSRNSSRRSASPVRSPVETLSSKERKLSPARTKPPSPVVNKPPSPARATKPLVQPAGLDQALPTGPKAEVPKGPRRESRGRLFSNATSSLNIKGRASH